MTNKTLLIIGAGLAVAALLLYRKQSAVKTTLTSQYGNGQTTDAQEGYYNGLDWDWGQYGKPKSGLTYV